MKQINSGVDGDIEQLANDLRGLADDLDEQRSVVVEIDSTHSVTSEGEEHATLTLDIVPTSDSLFQGGYTIPLDN